MILFSPWWIWVLTYSCCRLLGISCMQGWQYLNTNEDRWPMRVLVSPMFFPFPFPLTLMLMLIRSRRCCTSGNPSFDNTWA